MWTTSEELKWLTERRPAHRVAQETLGVQVQSWQDPRK